MGGSNDSGFIALAPFPSRAASWPNLISVAARRRRLLCQRASFAAGRPYAATNLLLNLRKLYGSYRLSGDAALATEGLLMAQLSEGEKQFLDDALSTLDDLYEVTLKPDGGFTSEQMEAIAKLAEEAMGCVLSVLDPEMYDAVQRDCPEKKLGREARAVRILTLLDEIPQKKLVAFDTADLLRRRLSLEEPVAVPLPLASNRGAAA
jgi:hypothetical protein